MEDRERRRFRPWDRSVGGLGWTQDGTALFNTLQNRGVKSRLVYYPDENHWYGESRAWLREFIGAGAAP